MSLNIKKIEGTGPKQENVEAGTYPGRVAQIIDLGVQNQRPFKGEEKPPAHSLYITYELVDEFCLDENGDEDENKPRWLSEKFPLFSMSADLAKSTKRYKALDPKDDHDGAFDELGGVACNVLVVENEGKGKNSGKVYNNIQGIATMRPKDAKKCAELKKDPVIFVLDDPDVEVFNNLPNWLQGDIKDNLDFSGSLLEQRLNGVEESPAEEEDDDDWGEDE